MCVRVKRGGGSLCAGSARGQGGSPHQPANQASVLPTNPTHPHGREYARRFADKVGEFSAALGEAHREAAAQKTDTREELESLLNLAYRCWGGGGCVVCVAGVLD